MDNYVFQGTDAVGRTRCNCSEQFLMRIPVPLQGWLLAIATQSSRVGSWAGSVGPQGEERWRSAQCEALPEIS